MLYIAVEIGTYSIKFINYQVDKKKIKIFNLEEIVLDYENMEHDSDYLYQWKLQLDAVSQYLEKIQAEYMLIVSLPGDIVTTRYLSLPVKNKKKAHQLLPFQIEEDLPFPLSDSHWAERLKQEGALTHATVGIIRRELFEEFFQQLKLFKVEPGVLTSDVSGYSQFIELFETDYEQTFAVLDIGHHVTKGFIFQDGVLVSNHQSFIAGGAITEAISKTYDISEDEAVIYKHQNSFLLVSEQYEQVNDNQKEFARVMDTTLEPLINEIKRWDIGHRVKYGQTIKTVYLTGATANIKNSLNYYSEKLEVPVKIFDPYRHVDCAHIDQDEKFRNKFSSLMTLVISTQKKSGFINYLKGEYVFTNKFGLPLDTFAFIATRTSLLSLFLCVYFLVSFFIANSRISDARKAATSVMKNSAVGLTSSQRAKRPEEIIEILEKKENSIVQEVQSIQASLKTNAFRHLQDILSFIQGYNVEVVYFSAVEDTSTFKDADELKHEIDFVLKGKKLDDIKAVQNSFESSPRGWKTSLDENKLELSVKGLGQNI